MIFNIGTMASQLTSNLNGIARDNSGKLIFKIKKLHVSAWLKNYIVPAILLEESKETFREYIAKVHRKNPDILEYYATGDRTDTEILLESARDITGMVSDATISIQCRTCTGK